jgi:hypothetical protein
MQFDYDYSQRMPIMMLSQRMPIMTLAELRHPQRLEEWCVNDTSQQTAPACEFSDAGWRA